MREKFEDWLEKTGEYTNLEIQELLNNPSDETDELWQIFNKYNNYV